MVFSVRVFVIIGRYFPFGEKNSMGAKVELI
jgi:hypothetical protein